MTKFYLGFQGSRSLKDERVKIIMLEEIEKHKPTTIVTSKEPGGVCAMAQEIAKEMAIPLKVHFLNFKYLRGAFEHRSKFIQADCDFCVFIHDGKSKGTANEIKLAKKIGIPYTIHILEPTEYKNNVEFPVLEGWGE